MKSSTPQHTLLPALSCHEDHLSGPQHFVVVFISELLRAHIAIVMSGRILPNHGKRAPLSGQ